MRCYVVFICVILVGCTPKLEPVTTSTDTIIRYKERILTLPSQHTITISEPCDSLGMLRNFRVNVNAGKVRSEVAGKGNEIVIIGEQDSIITRTDTIYKAREIKVVERQEVNKYPWYFSSVIIVLIISLLINLILLIFRR